ncbi:hypothetical protein KTS45_16730 [Halomicroarcula limicola]|uniref:Uncharacterized protein n=1 Tax=Haloarcula limicola TaxID=1429915 RepID=A0A8J7YEN4_9EURY|nr:hypothetical protein [Halomicroarcula limicola]MBV0925851.1 hypothetical protein [Halomicroarcula limicola]
MNAPTLAAGPLSVLSLGPLHAGPAAAPAPGWLVLFAAVLGLWAVIAVGVVLGDKLLVRLGEPK